MQDSGDERSTGDADTSASQSSGNLAASSSSTAVASPTVAPAVPVATLETQDQAASDAASDNTPRASGLQQAVAPSLPPVTNNVAIATPQAGTPAMHPVEECVARNMTDPGYQARILTNNTFPTRKPKGMDLYQMKREFAYIRDAWTTYKTALERGDGGNVHEVNDLPANVNLRVIGYIRIFQVEDELALPTVLDGVVGDAPGTILEAWRARKAADPASTSGGPARPAIYNPTRPSAPPSGSPSQVSPAPRPPVLFGGGGPSAMPSGVGGFGRAPTPVFSNAPRRAGPSPVVTAQEIDEIDDFLENVTDAQKAQFLTIFLDGRAPQADVNIKVTDAPNRVRYSLLQYVRGQLAPQTVSDPSTPTAIQAPPTNRVFVSESPATTETDGIQERPFSYVRPEPEARSGQDDGEEETEQPSLEPEVLDEIQTAFDGMDGDRLQGFLQIIQNYGADEDETIENHPYDLQRELMLYVRRRRIMPARGARKSASGPSTGPRGSTNAPTTAIVAAVTQASGVLSPSGTPTTGTPDLFTSQDGSRNSTAVNGPTTIATSRISTASTQPPVIGGSGFELPIRGPRPVSAAQVGDRNAPPFNTKDNGAPRAETGGTIAASTQPQNAQQPQTSGPQPPTSVQPPESERRPSANEQCSIPAHADLEKDLAECKKHRETLEADLENAILAAQPRVLWDSADREYYTDYEGQRWDDDVESSIQRLVDELNERTKALADEENTRDDIESENVTLRRRQQALVWNPESNMFEMLTEEEQSTGDVPEGSQPATWEELLEAYREASAAAADEKAKREAIEEQVAQDVEDALIRGLASSGRSDRQDCSYPPHATLEADLAAAKASENSTKLRLEGLEVTHATTLEQLRSVSRELRQSEANLTSALDGSTLESKVPPAYAIAQQNSEQQHTADAETISELEEKLAAVVEERDRLHHWKIEPNGCYIPQHRYRESQNETLQAEVDSLRTQLSDARSSALVPEECNVDAHDELHTRNEHLVEELADMSGHVQEVKAALSALNTQVEGGVVEEGECRVLEHDDLEARHERLQGFYDDLKQAMDLLANRPQDIECNIPRHQELQEEFDRLKARLQDCEDARSDPSGCAIPEHQRLQDDKDQLTRDYDALNAYTTGLMQEVREYLDHLKREPLD